MWSQEEDKFESIVMLNFRQPDTRQENVEASFCIIPKHNVGAERSWEVIENHELSLVCAGWFPEM